MRIAPLFVALVVSTVGCTQCGGGGTEDGGSAGGAAGGAAGGTAGGAGDGGNLPGCSSLPNLYDAGTPVVGGHFLSVLGFALHSGDGGWLDTTFDGGFTVSDAGSSSVFVLEASTRQPQVSLDINGLWFWLVPGDPVELDVEAAEVPLDVRYFNQTFRMWRRGQLIAFGARLGGTTLPIPDFRGDAVVTHEGPVCVEASTSCTRQYHRARVSIGANSALFRPGDPIMVGDFWVTLSRFDTPVADGGLCSPFSYTMVIGLRIL